MTQDEINVFGIAFFSGKTLQFKPAMLRDWEIYTGKDCPAFYKNGGTYQWRIQPDESNEPNTEIWCTFRNDHGYVVEATKDSEAFKHYTNSFGWAYIQGLDREVTLHDGVDLCLNKTK